MHEYRLSPDKLCAEDFRRLHSRGRDYYPYGKRDWIAAIRKLYKRGGEICAGYLQDNHSHLYSQGVWLFGSWDEALRAAGFTLENMRLWGYWDQAKLISQIQDLRKNKLPLYAKYVMKNHSKVFSAARRQCGSWGKALLATDNQLRSTPHGRLGCIGFLQTLRDALGIGSGKDLPQSIKSGAVYYFGSLQKAIVATKGEGVGESTKTKIKLVLCRMHNGKQSLVYVEARRNHLALVRVAEKHFGSWGKHCMLPASIPICIFRQLSADMPMVR